MTQLEEQRSQMEIPILHEESHFMVVNKPAGVFTQAAPGVPSLEVTLVQQIKERDQHPGSPFVGLPHRLDRATSGVLLIARNQRALGKFGQQFQSRKISKRYLSVMHGTVPEGIHHWSDYLRKIPDVPKAEIVSPDAEGARLAEMRIESVASNGTHSLAVIELMTGRMHQIRVQSASRGFAILGDQLYRDSLPGEEQENIGEAAIEIEMREQPHALHAYQIGFFHPQNAKAMTCSAPIPAFWEAWLPWSPEQVTAALANSQLLLNGSSVD